MTDPIVQPNPLPVDPVRYQIDACIAQEVHFNGLQHKYRQLAITIVTGYFVALGALAQAYGARRIRRAICSSRYCRWRR